MICDTQENNSIGEFLGYISNEFADLNFGDRNCVTIKELVTEEIFISENFLLRYKLISHSGQGRTCLGARGGPGPPKPQKFPKKLKIKN
jgi:hypothetical protein